MSTGSGNKWTVTLPCDEKTRQGNPKAEKKPGLELETLEISDSGRKTKASSLHGPLFEVKHVGSLHPMNPQKPGYLLSPCHREASTPQPPSLPTCFLLGTAA